MISRLNVESALYFLQDEDVKLWHDNLSVMWRDVSLRTLGRFSETAKLSPKEFIELEKQTADMLQKYVQNMAKSTNPKSGKLYYPGYVDNCMVAVKSWASSQDKEIKRKIRIVNELGQTSDRNPSLEFACVPLAAELRNCVYDAKTNGRTRVSIVLMIFSGFRPEVLGNDTGTDGLRICDVPEMKIGNGAVSFVKFQPYSNANPH